MVVYAKKPEDCVSYNCTNLITFEQNRVRRLAQPRIIRVRASSSPSKNDKKHKKEFEFDYERKTIKK